MQASLGAAEAGTRRVPARLARAPWLHIAATAALAGGCLALFAYLLARFPFDGLYGQDSYAYYHESVVLLDELRGVSPSPGALFTADSLGHWPVGYHLLLMLGLVFNQGPAGGRALTILTALGSVALTYLIAIQLLPGAHLFPRIAAGVAAGAALPLTAIFTRTALSIMSDVPALFWSLLAVYCLLRAYPPPTPRESVALPAHRRAWEVAAGVGLGLAVLTRYGAGLLVVPLLLYLLARRAGLREALPLWPAAGFVMALVPQGIYLAAHPAAGAHYGDWLAGWSPANFLSSTVTNPDGTMHFAHTMLSFYLLDPLLDQAVGFLPALYLPAILLGVGRLIAGRGWAQLVLLISWWLVPALFFGGTLYQAHRFVLAYLPALLLLFGVGVATAVGFLLTVAVDRKALRFAAGLLSVGVLVCALLGAWRAPAADRSALAGYHALKVEEQAVISLADKAVAPGTGPPRVVSFGITAALYHYTGWAVTELYNADAPGIERFLHSRGPALVIVPLGALSTQWAGTALARRWQWLQDRYKLRPQGVAGEYTVFRVEAPR